MSKRVSKYIASFDYFDIIFLSGTSGSTSIASFATVIGTPAGAGASLSLILSTGLVKNY